MVPFGFINPTHLIGWDGKCNNPFINDKSDDRMLVDVDDRVREYFGNRVFVSYDGMVCDATCGPALGTQTLGGYLETSINRRTTLYTKWSKFTKWNPPRLTGGLVQDVSYGVGARILEDVQVSDPALGTMGLDDGSVETFLNNNGIPNEDQVDDQAQGRNDLRGLIFDSLGRLLEGVDIAGKKLRIIHADHDLQKHAAPLTWTRKVEKSPHTINFVIYICDTDQLASRLLWRPWRRVPRRLSEIYTPTRKDFRKAKRHLVGKSGTGVGHQILVVHRILVKIDGLENSEALEPLLQAVHNYILNPNPAKDHYDDIGKVEVVSTVSTPPRPASSAQNHYPLHSNIEVTLKAPGANAVAVHYTDGDLFLPGPQVLSLGFKGKQAQPSGVFILRFVARRTGSGTAEITFADSTFTNRKVHKLELTIKGPIPHRGSETPIFYLDGRLTFRRDGSISTDIPSADKNQSVWSIENGDTRSPPLCLCQLFTFKGSGQFYANNSTKSDYGVVAKSVEHKWNHIVTVHEDSITTLYLNGTQIAQAKYLDLQGLTSSLPRIAFGRGLPSRPRVWQRRVALEDVQKWYKEDPPAEVFPNWSSNAT
ncbi:hypothetical protein FRB94_008613 [Tulasnella sp. JGI-2019a]|nr:hypothetical protein FRB94_008613 [Tulasnella sp. JGI-2019a]